MHKVIRSKTWYGIPAVVAVKTGIVHIAGFGYLRLPHPPLVNLLLRRDVDEPASLELNISHEFGHLQALPFVLVYVVILVWYALTYQVAGVLVYIFLLTSIQAFWEILAEAYVVRWHRMLYAGAYLGIVRWPRLVFWVVMSGVAIAVWIRIPHI